MATHDNLIGGCVLVALGLLPNLAATAQTPEQQQQWDAQRAQSIAEGQATAERLSRAREARKADPMSWVHGLNPMAAGGWEFRTVADDGSWAAFSTKHQLKRNGALVTVWLRQEYAEPQIGSGGKYSSAVEKIQYDCAKERARPLLIIYYAEANLQGSEQSEEVDVKAAVWNAIVPGTRDEFNFLWACGSGK